MKWRLLVNQPPQTSYRFEHQGPCLTIGRDPACSLSFADEVSQGVSWEHAACEATGTGVVLKDLGSTNGTYLNGQRLSQTVPLRVGDEVRLGQKGPRLQVLELMDGIPEPAEQQDHQDHLLMCPECGKETPSLKCYTLPYLVVFLLLFAHVQKATYTLCPRCMRKVIMQRALINVIPANFVAPPLCIGFGIGFLATFLPGHSRSLRD
jgi:hypothetical protein